MHSGTVDLIVFEIDERAGRKLRECTKGHGQSCGSVFLDRRMRKLLKKKFKEYLSSIPASSSSFALQHIMCFEDSLDCHHLYHLAANVTKL